MAGIDTTYSMKFCVEYAAIAVMIISGESRIINVIVVYEEGIIITPC